MAIDVRESEGALSLGELEQGKVYALADMEKVYGVYSIVGGRVLNHEGNPGAPDNRFYRELTKGEMQKLVMSLEAESEGQSKLAKFLRTQL